MVKEQELENNNRRLKQIFLIFLSICIFTNFDTGVIPASIDLIQKELNISYCRIAALRKKKNFNNL